MMITTLILLLWTPWSLINLSVAEHPFLNISYKNSRRGRVEVNEGRRKIVLDPKVNALPQPDMVAWYVML